MAAAVFNDAEDTYEVPLKDQRFFGAGLKRKRVHFVPSGSTGSTFEYAPPRDLPSLQSVGDRYLAIVRSGTSSLSVSPNASPDPSQQPSNGQICGICGLPFTRTLTMTGDPPNRQPHAASLPHQVCLPHSHPPSHLPRTSKGLSYLRFQGWDPDARLGLGAHGNEGRLYPVNVRQKQDTLGVGAVVPSKEKNGELQGRIEDTDVLGLRKLEDSHRRTMKKVCAGGEKERSRLPAERNRMQKLDAGRMRRKDEEERRKRMRLQEMFYRSEDVERYLGT